MITLYLMTWPPPARGPALSLPHHHGDTTGWAALFLRSLVRAFAWQTARGVFDTFGLVAVLMGLLVAVLAWRRYRRGGER